MSIWISPNLPANVVEIGNEITQAKVNEINSGTLALQTWVTSGFAPKASPTFTGTVTIPAGASIAGYLPLSGGTLTGTLIVTQVKGTYNNDFVINANNDGFGSGPAVDFLHTFTNVDGRLILASNGGGLTFPDSTTQTTAGYPNSNPSGYIADAPSDGNIYGRQNGAWVII
jgi:hypothetical protein